MEITWHFQEKDNIYDEMLHFGLEYRFACLMKDGTLREWRGMINIPHDENTRLECVDGNYDNVDDIEMWSEIPDRTVLEYLYDIKRKESWKKNGKKRRNC